MSKYEEICEAYTESYKRSYEHVNACCNFATFVFKRMSEYGGWPQCKIMFFRDESLEISQPICNSHVAYLKNDGFIYFVVCFYLKNNDNPNLQYRVIAPTKVKKFETKFFIEIPDIEAKYLLGENDTDELEKFFEYTFEKMTRHFDTPHLDWNVPGWLGGIESDVEDGDDEWK
jgi:hypothetical protein